MSEAPKEQAVLNAIEDLEGRNSKYIQDMLRAHLATIEQQQAEIERLRDTNRRLHRRTQEAERDAYRKAGRVLRKTEDWKSMFHRCHKRARKWEDEAMELRKMLKGKEAYIHRLETLRGPGFARQARKETTDE